MYKQKLVITEEERSSILGQHTKEKNSKNYFSRLAEDLENQLNSGEEKEEDASSEEMKEEDEQEEKVDAAACKPVKK